MSPPGTEIIRVSATDADKPNSKNTRFYFYLHPPENELFRLDSKTGVLTSNMMFDREVNSRVSLRHSLTQCIFL